MMPRIVSSAALCAIAVLVAACASAPTSRFYTLSRTATPGAAPATFSVVVGPVAIPAVVDLPQIVVSTGPNQVTLEDLRRAINDANRVVQNADATLFSKDSPAPQDLRDTLQEVTRAARSIRVLVDYLERHPDVLIRGKPAEKQ